MAKKTTPAEPTAHATPDLDFTSTSLIPVVQPNVTSEVQLHADSLLAVGVVGAEDALHARRKEIKTSISVLKKAHDTEEAVLKAACISNVLPALNELVAAFNKTGDTFGSAYTATAEAEVDFAKRVVTTTVVLAANRKCGYGDTRCTLAVNTVKFDDESVNMADTLVSVDNQIKVLRDEDEEIRKRLLNVPAIERRINAAVARSVLSKTPHGQALLDSAIQSAKDFINNTPLLK